MKWKHLPIVAFDTETTGLEPFAGDRVIEIAMVTFQVDPDTGAVVGREDWSQLLNPEREIPRKVTEITGISDKEVARAPRFAEVAATVRQRLANAITVAHNYPFDLAFLTREFDLLRQQTGDRSWAWPEPLAEVDTVDLSMRVDPDARSHKLADLAERLGVGLDRAHRATDDAAACGLAFVELVRRHTVADELQLMLDWANAIGRPPESGPLGPDEHGRIVFLEGPHQGEPVTQHPIHLAWMDKARARGPRGDWQWRYSDAVRRWARRWLEVRGAGRARQGQKTFHSSDWVLDPCTAAPRTGRAAGQGSLGGAAPGGLGGAAGGLAPTGMG